MKLMSKQLDAGELLVEHTRQTLVQCVNDRVRTDGWLIGDMAKHGGLSKLHYMRSLEVGTNCLRVASMVAFGAGHELNLDLKPR